MILNVIYVALGGALGAMARYLMGLALLRAISVSFPVAVLPLNVLGSFLMGVFVVWSAQKGMGHLNLFVMTGILGGFTTFSAFSLETVTLIERGAWTAALLYVGLSVILSVAGLALGATLARGIWA